MTNSTFSEGPILPKLLKFSLPILLALFLQAAYGAVDLWAVGKFSSAADMSAVSTGSQTLLVITGFITGLCMGITVLLGQRIGEKNYQKASEIIGASIWLLGFFSILITLFLLFFSSTLATLVHTPPEALKQTVTYLRICGAGVVFIVAYNGLGGIFRGLGNSKLPLLFVFISCILNIVGDVLLIRNFQMGAAGAAIATVTAQACSVLFSFYYIKTQGLPFPLAPDTFRFHKQTSLKILKLGLPIGCTDMGNEICYLILIGFTNQLGVLVSAGVGVAEKVIIFLLLIPMSYMSSVSAFVAQNIGAGQPLRARKSMWLGMLTAGFLGLIMSSLLFFRGDLLSWLFASSEEVVAVSARFLQATALECLILSVAYCLTGYFNGIGKSTFVMIQGLCANFLIKVPYAYFALHFMEDKLFQIGFANVYGALFILFICLIYYIMTTLIKREQNRLFVE